MFHQQQFNQFCILILVTFFLVGCSAFIKNDISQDDVSVNKTQITPMEVLESSSEVMSNLDTLRFRIVHESGDTELFPGIYIDRMDVSIVFPDEYHVKFYSKGNSNQITKGEVIVSEGKTFITNPFSGKLEELSSGSSPLKFFEPQAGIQSIFSSIEEVTFVNEVEDSSQQALLSGKMPANALLSIFGNLVLDEFVDVELLIDLKTKHLTEAKIIGPIVSSDSTEVVRKIEFVSFNKKFQIKKID